MSLFSLLSLTYLYSFEHSLVQELGYNGYERLRRGFDRAFGGSQFVPTFPLVIDAGCGTGLVGKQVSTNQ
jgi:predicted TPR repeat methyltransferase